MAASEIELSCVEVYYSEVLGIGAYGKVCKAKYGPQLPCAAKLLNDPKTHNLHISKFLQECQFLSTMNHPNVVQYLGTSSDPQSQWPILLMELMDESLTKFLKRLLCPLPYHSQLNMCHDVALALAYLHSNAIIHRDLSSNNVLLIDEGSRAKVTDFGMSKLVDMNPHMTPLTQVPGTLAYMPPEALTTPPRYSNELDSFSHGVLTLQIVTGNFPNPGDPTATVEDKRFPTGRTNASIPEAERRKKDIDLIEPSHPLLPIALHCLKDRDTERPSADELCGRLASLKREPRYKECNTSKKQEKGESGEIGREKQLGQMHRKKENQEQIDQYHGETEKGERLAEDDKITQQERQENLHEREKENPLPMSDHKRGLKTAPKASEFDVVAMYDYPGLERGDLSLVKGQKVTVFDDTREYWWRARDTKGNEGYIPRNYVKKAGMDSEDWFFPNLSKTRAENILKSEGREGGFVVRNSSRVNMYTLSICHDGIVRHYHIQPDETQKYFISEKYRFPSIKKLIEYHKLNGGGLVTRLRRPPDQLVPAPKFDEAWEINKSELVLGRELELGSGQFQIGHMVAGKWKGKVDIAIKIMQEGAMNEDDFIEEAMHMKKFQHENLVKFYGVCTGQGPIFIVQELMVKGSLLQFMRQNKEIVERVEIILDMALQINSAMYYLEKNGFIHRDLAAHNCLVGKRNIVKVAGFSCTRFVMDDEYIGSEGEDFPFRWVSPEVMTHSKYSSKSDVWSFGILLWELWTGGKTPYPTFTDSQVLDEVLLGYRLEKPKFCPTEQYDLMRKCWLPNAEDRPTFHSLYSSLNQLNADVED